MKVKRAAGAVGVNHPTQSLAIYMAPARATLEWTGPDRTGGWATERGPSGDGGEATGQMKTSRDL